ncbi:hypothetical protein CAPTEDRAFT_188964 [Capitella teleta]|uniref:Uncharacterized protein n=1 Tax=Capitella teleta TaxID=283909 RepID=R7UI14_CAPTE|nr:hypothetical protein CAPTEDRAFT_188964 [Capitella teleta]|eukprot:ELU03413.1 hypothetical protein CAPTEDRAFT_188964 [Capitella teleta]
MAEKQGESVGQKLHEFAAHSTVHGVSHAWDIKRSGPRRVIWFLLLLGFCAFFLYVASDRIAKYKSHPIGTRIRVIDKKPTDFPAVTFCNMNVLRKTFIEADEFLLNVIRALKGDPRSTVNVSDPELRRRFDEKYTMGDIFKKGAHTPNTTFTKCIWGGEDDICHLYMTPYSTQMGHCFTFNSYDYVMQHGSLQANRIGVEGGLQLNLNVHQDEYLYQDFKHKSAGFKVLVHHPFTWPLISDLGTAIAPGTETYLAIEEVLVKRLPSDFGDESSCVSTDDPSFVNPLEFIEKYSKEGCVYNCLVKYVIHGKGCKCRPWNLHANNITDCSLGEYLDCVTIAQYEFSKNQTFLDLCDCRDTCTEAYFRVRKSEALYPSDLALGEMSAKEGRDETYFRKNIIDLKIYFESLSYELIEEYESYTLTDLQSDIGGNLGLCLGASFLSLAEFGEIILLLLTSMFKKCIRIETRATPETR